MNLLLLLSALLSALTGLGASVRQPAAPAAMAQQTRQVVVAAKRSVAARPVQSLASLADRAIAPLLRAWALIPSEPVFASRRRE